MAKYYPFVKTDMYIEQINSLLSTETVFLAHLSL